MLLLPTFLNYSSPQEMFSMAPFPFGMFLFGIPQAAAGGGWSCNMCNSQSPPLLLPQIYEREKC